MISTKSRIHAMIIAIGRFSPYYYCQWQKNLLNEQSSSCGAIFIASEKMWSEKNLTTHPSISKTKLRTNIALTNKKIAYTIMIWIPPRSYRGVGCRAPSIGFLKDLVIVLMCPKCIGIRQMISRRTLSFCSSASVRKIYMSEMYIAVWLHDLAWKSCSYKLWPNRADS